MRDAYWSSLVLSLLVALILLFRRGPAKLNALSRAETLPLRGVLALLVAFGHIDLVAFGGGDYARILHFGSEAVGVFFLLSGYGMMKSLRAKGAAYANGLFPRTLRKLAPAYLACIALFLPVLLIWGTDWLRECLHVFTRGDTFFLPHSWYVPALLGWTALFALASRRFSGGRVAAAVVAGAAVYYAVMVLANRWGPWWYRTAALFPLGVVFAWFEADVRRLLERYGRACGIALAAVTCGFLFGTDPFPALHRLPVVGDIPYVLLGVNTAVFLLVTPVCGNCRVMDFIGGISYEIYLVHPVLYVPLVKLGVPVPVMETCAMALLIPAAWGVQRFCRLFTERRSA